MLFFTIFFTPDVHAQAGISFWSYWADGTRETNIYTVERVNANGKQQFSDNLNYSICDFDLLHFEEVPSNTNQAIRLLKFEHSRFLAESTGEPTFNLTVFSPVSVNSHLNDHARSVTPIKTVLQDRASNNPYIQTVFARKNVFVRKLVSTADDETEQDFRYEFDRDLIFEDDLLVRLRELNAPFPEGRYKILTSSYYSGGLKNAPRVEYINVGRYVSKDVEETVLGISKVITYEIQFKKRSLQVKVLSSGARNILSWEHRSLLSGQNFNERAFLKSSQKG